MHIPSLSTTAITLLLASNAFTNLVEAKVDVLSWDAAYAKAKVLVGKMSLKQKVSIATGVGWGNGLCVGNTYGTSNPDFPELCLQDAPLGICTANNVTSGVAGVNAAASFDKTQIYNRGSYMGKEFRGKGIHIQLGPVMNFLRSPEGGRGWESASEDPFLTGVVAAQTIQGIQSEGVIATAKHFILNDQELNRTTSSSDVDRRTLHEIYLWPFARAVEAGIGSTMCSYNMANGTYVCEDDYFLNTVLKGELGFRGFVQSDWGAIHSTVKVANGGLDMTMPGDVLFDGSKTSSFFGGNLTEAVKDKEVSETRAIDMAICIVASWYKTVINAFDVDKAPVVNVQANHKKLVRELGAASSVLLKNVDSALPIDPKKVKKIAIIGSDAGPNPNGLNECEYNGCDNGTLAQGWGSGLTAAFGKKVKIQSNLNDWDLDAAAKTAEGADYALVFSNSDSGENIGSVDGNLGDRNNISLWHDGDNLIKAVADANKNTIVVIHAVGAVLMPWINHSNIKAVLWPGLPGQESGNSFADIVTGKVNPSARLPYTIAKKASDYNAKPSPKTDIEYSEKSLMGYKWFDHTGIEPLFPFGHGLSYTSFEYSNLKVQASTNKKTKDANVTATISIKNAGHVDGAKVVQAYLSFPESAGEPPKVLRGFLKQGKQEQVEFQLGKTELSIWDTVSNAWVIPSGEFTLHIGASSRDIRKSASFTI